MIRAWLRKILSKYTGIYASRYLVLLIDFMLMSIAFFITWFIRFNFQPIEFAKFPILNSYFFVAFIYLVYFLVFQTYVGIIRYTGYIDTIKIFQACVAAVGTIFLGVYFYKVSFHNDSYFMPIGVVVIHCLLTMFNLISTRVLFKVVYISLIGETRKGKKSILIYGAGQSGLLTLNTLTADPKSGVEVVGFIDDNHSKKGKSLMGIKIYSSEQVLTSIIEKHQVEEIIIAIQNISANKKSNILAQFIDCNIQVKTVPPINRWINGELSINQIKAVRIEDLLSREPIKLNAENIYYSLSNKTILITGAAGSIGSEIARQVVGYKPKLIIFVDQAESPMYELELNLRNKIERLHVSTKFIIADVSNKCAMDRIFILHADHEQNASTSTVRLCGSSGTNPFAAIAAGVACLWGPAHGGANEACLNMLEDIQRMGGVAKVGEFMEKVKDKNSGVKLMGFGHRVYKNYDPRAKLMQETCDEVLKELGLENDPLFKLAKALEKIALEDDYFVSRKLYPNVDFYSGIVQRAIGIPVNLFTGIFALARTVGWIAQLNEMIGDPEYKIGRPRQLFTGSPRRNVPGAK